MMYALAPDGDSIQATRAGQAACPGCRQAVIPKCGEILIWHWAHRAGLDCDRWFEPECAWHLRWKGIVGDRARVEVVMGAHRADIVCPDGRVVELQHSPISPAEIRARENFYRRMLWLIDLTEPSGWEPRKRGDIWTFRWKHPRRSWQAAKQPLFFDLGERVFEVRTIYFDETCAGSVLPHTPEAFARRWLGVRGPIRWPGPPGDEDPGGQPE